MPWGYTGLQLLFVLFLTSKLVMSKFFACLSDASENEYTGPYSIESYTREDDI